MLHNHLSPQEYHELLSSGFDAARDFTVGRISLNYYWRRKRKEVLRLLRKNGGRIQNTSPSATNGRLFIELGCGEGVEFFLIRDLLPSVAGNGWRFVGVDGPALIIRVNQLKQQHYSANDCEFHSWDFSKKLPQPDGTADLIYCSEVLEHMSDPESFVKEIHRVLKPGGFLLATTPNEPNVFQRSFWSKARRKRLAAEQQTNLKSPLNSEGAPVECYGHISLKTCREWDALALRCGLRLVDSGRGAIFYGGSDVHEQEFVFGTRLITEGILDLFPRRWVRNLSDQMVSFYERVC